MSAAAPGIGRGLGGAFLAWLLLPVAVLAGLATIGGSGGFVALTMAGFAVGSAYFLMASGLTLVFGLTGIVDFGHGAFVPLGAFVAAAVLALAPGLAAAPAPLQSLAPLGAALLAAMAATALAGWLWQRIGAPRAGATLPRLVILGLGGLIVSEQLIAATWGGGPVAVAPPEVLRGAVALPGAGLRAIDLAVIAAGACVALALASWLHLTRSGLVLRAALEDGERVQALGYRLGRVAAGMAVLGAALAALGGAGWALLEGGVTPRAGRDALAIVFLVVLAGGPGSLHGAFLAAALVGLAQAYGTALEPALALVGPVALVAAILIWRPGGLMPMAWRG